MQMYSFTISSNKNILAIVCVDEKDENIGFVSNDTDIELINILNYVVDMPYLLTITGDKVDSSYVELNEKITLKDARFLPVLKSQLLQYDFSKPKKHDNKTVREVLDEEKLNLRN